MQIQPYTEFWQKIHQSAQDKSFPLRVMFELTYRCNFYCKHCYVPFKYRKYKELKTKEVFAVIDQLADIGCFYLGFTGGEPFIRKDTFNILWYARKKGFEVIIYTNGALIDRQKAEELARLRPNKVDITIPAMAKYPFERITQIEGSHRKVFGAIELLHKKGVALGFKTCVLKENEDEIEDIQKFAESFGALHRLDDMFSPRLDGSREPFKYRGVLKNSRPELKCQGEVEKHNSEIRHPAPSARHFFKCGVGLSQAAITPQGELKMCLMIDYPKYKILETSLKECWKRLRDLVSDIKPDEKYQCANCEFQPYCKWCPARGWLKDKSFTSCDAESKRWARDSFELVRQ